MIELCDADYRTGSSIAKITHLRAPDNIEVSASGRCDHNFELVVSTCRPRVSISDTPWVLSETIGVVADGWSGPPPVREAAVWTQAGGGPD